MTKVTTTMSSIIYNFYNGSCCLKKIIANYRLMCLHADDIKLIALSKNPKHNIVFPLIILNYNQINYIVTLLSNLDLLK